MAREVRSAVLLLFFIVAGCGDLHRLPGDASQADTNPVDVASLLPDSPQLLTDGSALLLDAIEGSADAEVGQALGQSDTDSTETGAIADADVIPPSGDGGLAPELSTASPVTVVVLPDTQYYASTYPDAFTAQTKWIVDQKPALNIAAVLHVGDIVDAAYSTAQWNVASTAMGLLAGVVPYVVVPGNHDADGNRNGLIDTYFGPKTMSWIAGTMTDGQIENSYALVDIGPQQWLVLGLEFGPRDTVISWADTVLKAYPDRPAILLTHAYLYHDGTRYNIAVGGTDSSQPSYQFWNPQYYGVTASQGINDGEQIWQKLVLPNRNVRLVFSGHDTGAARLTSLRPDGSRVHQMLSDYQWLGGVDFGYGYLRVLQFDYDKKTIQVQTYSPYLDNYLTDDANQFTVSLEL
jgi:hypothetical protein